jgi:hypothetical protein
MLGYQQALCQTGRKRIRMNCKANSLAALPNPGRQWHVESGFVGFATNGPMAMSRPSKQVKSGFAIYR